MDDNVQKKKAPAFISKEYSPENITHTQSWDNPPLVFLSVVQQAKKSVKR